MPKSKTPKRGDWIKDEKSQKLLVEMWGDYINWEKRRKMEKGWLVNRLKRFNCKKVFDSCVGDGCDAIYLIKQGFDVVGNDIDDVFIQKTLQNIKKENVQLNITNLDWRELTKQIPEQSFDAVLCTGNSLCCLFGRGNRIKALKQFYAILKKKGILIIDERNYQYVLDNREEILRQKPHTTGCMYCGEHVYFRIIEIKDNRIKYKVCREEKDKKAAFIAVIEPFRQGELKKSLEKVGFKTIEQYSDYQVGEKPKAIFYMYICQK